jgi:hypothetical protein
MKHFVLPLVLVGSAVLPCLMPADIRAETLFRTDFSASSPAWPSAISATVQAANAGTVDVAEGTEPSPALRASPGKSAMTALVSGLLPVRTSETSLGKLTLAFSLSSSANMPVRVRIESFDAKRKRTGALMGTIYPAAPDFFQRYALDLNMLKPDGTGRFQPTAPFVQFTFESDKTREIRLDNVNYSTPAFYVSPEGSDTSDGRSEKRAFATPQKALDAAQAGDIIVLMEGTYSGGQSNVASFRRAGTPDAWIVLKNYPGQKPILTGTGWNIVSIAAGSKEKPDTETSFAYLEIRGLHVRGEGDVAKKKYPEAMNKSDSRTNSNGIAADGRYMKNPIHHLRFADNLVEYCPGQGLGALESDWVTIENNVSRFNCWTTIYATSGISTLGATNFDGLDNVYKNLIRNNTCYRNQTYEIWEAIKRPSDGNGIIIDVNQKTTDRPMGAFRGRTLVQSNLCFDNGGSGIHTVTANRVDIIGNTTYLNSANELLQYSQIFTYGSEDVRIMNNILVAPVADLAKGEKPEPVNRLGGKNVNVVFSHNLYFGGNIAPTLGDGDVIANPRFVRPSRDGKVADFHLREDSPAVGKGISLPFAPFLDRAGKPRKNPPTEGAYEK